MSEASLLVNGRRYPVPQQGLRIGRAPENDVVLPDPNVSRQHLVIWATPRGAYLRDLGSQNGTFLNGRRVGPGPETIPSGALIRVGVTDLRVEVDGANGAGPTTGPTLGGVGTGILPGVDPGAGQAYGPSGQAYGAGGGARVGPAQGPGGGASVGPAYVPGGRPGPGQPAARQSSSTGLIIGGIIALVIIAMVGTGALVLRAVSDSRASATPTATARPVAVSSTSTPASTATTQPTATTPAKPTAAPKPTEAPKPTTPPQPTAAPTAASGGRDPAFVRALNASVRVIVPINANTASTGSGSVITAKGHILTNYHVVSDENTGRLINQGNNITIAVPPNEGDPAQAKYLAKVVQFDSKFDLAILQILTMSDGRPLPANLGLTPIPVGDSSKMQIGDPIIIIGFPGLGGSSLTVTRGIDSGIARFSDDPGSFIKTDTEINRGNSGGTAINSAGELIGIPTAGRVDTEASGKIGLVRPINEAKALIAKVSQ